MRKVKCLVPCETFCHLFSVCSSVRLFLLWSSRLNAISHFWEIVPDFLVCSLSRCVFFCTWMVNEQLQMFIQGLLLGLTLFWSLLLCMGRSWISVDVEARGQPWVAFLRRNSLFFLGHGYMSLELTDSAKLAQMSPQRCTCLSCHGFKITRADYLTWHFHVSSGGQT